jgi:hypothetical protein
MQQTVVCFSVTQDKQKKLAPSFLDQRTSAQQTTGNILKTKWLQIFYSLP